MDSFRFAELLSEVRNDTVENVERKQARTDAEREESEGEVSEEEPEEEPDDDIPYNPKNLPLGWDGKPIPYWLYKLHGLNISYNCEICGNYTYKVGFKIPPSLIHVTRTTFLISAGSQGIPAPFC